MPPCPPQNKNYSPKWTESISAPVTLICQDPSDRWIGSRRLDKGGREELRRTAWNCTGSCWTGSSLDGERVGLPASLRWRRCLTVYHSRPKHRVAPASCHAHRPACTFHDTGRARTGDARRQGRRRARKPLCCPNPPATSDREPGSTLLDERRYRRVGRHLGFHDTVRAARAQGPRGRGADHRCDRGQLRIDPRRSPMATAAACSNSGAIRCSSGSRARATLRGPAMRRWRCAGSCAPRPHRVPRREGHACGCRRACIRDDFHFFAAGTSPRIVACGARRGVVPSRWSMRRRQGEIRAQSGNGRAPSQPDASAHAKGPGLLLQRDPSGRVATSPLPPAASRAEMLVRCLSPAIRAHVLEGGGTSEHRPVTIAFIRFEGTDAPIERIGPRRGGRGTSPNS